MANTTATELDFTEEKELKFTEERIVTTIRLFYPVENTPWFVLRLVHDSRTPEQWILSFVDYDGAIGVEGYFHSEEEALEHFDAFVDLVFPLYNDKHAKYGPVPRIDVVDGKLVTTIYPPYGSSIPDFANV